MAYVDSETALFVLSDHGFTSFERGVDLNAWLLQNGYLALKEGAAGTSSYLKDVDWSRTRAYTFGLAGVYINQKGREAEGIVDPGEAACAEARTRREALRTVRRAARPARGTPGLAIRLVVHRPVPGRRARRDRGIRRRLPRVVGFGRRQSDRRMCLPTTRRRGAAIIAWTRTWFPACCSPTGRSRRRTPGSKTWRPPPWISSASSRRPTWRASPCSSRNGVPLQQEVAA